MVASSDLQQIASWQSESTDADGISAALVRVWSEAARPPAAGDGGGPQAGGIQRTRIANLLVYADREEQAAHAKDILGQLARRYPIRSLLCESRPDAGRGTLSADLRILAEPVEGRRIYFEQVHVSADVAQAPQLGGVATMLALHDLPTVLWCPGSPQLDGPALAGLSELADLVVVDSAEFGGQTNELAVVARALEGWHGGRALSDLNWDRLTDWREVIAQFFDSPNAHPLLDRIRRVEFLVAAPDSEHAADSAQALLMAAWLGSRLGWRCTGAGATGGEAAISMQRGDDLVEVRIGAAAQSGQVDLSLRSVRIEAGSDGNISRFVLTASESTVDHTAMMEICEGESTTRCFVLAEHEEAELLGEEIETFGRERALDDALQMLAVIIAAIQR